MRAGGYNGSTLAVLFHTSNTVYEHPGVPLSVFLGLMAVASMGAFYNQFIRGPNEPILKTEKRFNPTNSNGIEPMRKALTPR